jgi:riboflavin kinase
MIMSDEKLFCLLELAQRGADGDYVKTSTQEIGDAIGKSQQTASRLLSQMFSEGLIDRKAKGRGRQIKITHRGLSYLAKIHQSLSKIFEGRVVEGEVFTGVGEGRYYISRGGYRNQFREKLGFDPYPGTLNINVPATVVDEISSRSGIHIDGFQTGDRSFGGGVCYLVEIESDTRGAIFLPERTHYPRDVLEIISPHNLRERLEISDGDTVRLTLLASS